MDAAAREEFAGWAAALGAPLSPAQLALSLIHI